MPSQSSYKVVVRQTLCRPSHAIVGVDQFTSNCDKEKAEILGKFFSSVFTVV